MIFSDSYLTLHWHPVKRGALFDLWKVCPRRFCVCGQLNPVFSQPPCQPYVLTDSDSTRESQRLCIIKLAKMVAFEIILSSQLYQNQKGYPIALGKINIAWLVIIKQPEYFPRTTPSFNWADSRSNYLFCFYEILIDSTL